MFSGQVPTVGLPSTDTWQVYSLMLPNVAQMEYCGIRSDDVPWATPASVRFLQVHDVSARCDVSRNPRDHLRLSVAYVSGKQALDYRHAVS